MASLSYRQLEMQSYFKLGNCYASQAKTMLRYRFRLADFSENCRGPKGLQLCPLCELHIDNQTNIAFARGGAHLPIAHTLRLPKPCFLIFLEGVPYPIFFCTNLLVRFKLGYPPNFNFLGKPLLGEKYVEGKKKERRKRNNNAKFSGHYVYPRTETVRAHALRSHQCLDYWPLCKDY